MEASVTIKPSLTLNIPTNTITMNLDPSNHSFDQKDLTVSVGTNNKDGYTLYVNTENSTTTLTNVADNTKTITNLSTSVTPTDFSTCTTSDCVNKWGFRKTLDSTTSTGNYGAFTPGAIRSSNVPVNNDVTTLGFGAKIDYTKESGLYNLNLEFKALPLVTATYIQDITPDMCTEDPLVVADMRDGQTYTISRLKDGNCWMTQNLKLGKYSDSLTLTSADSDVGASGFTLNGKSADGKFTSKTIDGITNVNNSSEYYCDDDYGCYYNWYTATGGSGTSYITAGDVDYSICPAGWTLPTGADGGQFEALYAQYPSPSQMLVDPNSATENINSASRPGFTLAGNYNNTGPSTVGTNGRYWSRSLHTSYGGQYAASLLLYTTSVDPHNNNSKYLGIPMRCVLKEGTPPTTFNQAYANAGKTKDVTTGLYSMQDMNTSICSAVSNNQQSTLLDIRDNQKYAVAKINNICWMTNDLAFAGTTLTTTTSDVKSTRTIPAYYSLKTQASSSGSNNQCYGNDRAGDGYSNACKYDESGVFWYNYAAATARTIINSPTTTNTNPAEESICPKQWTLPDIAQIRSIAGIQYYKILNPSTGEWYNGTKYTNGGIWASTAYSNYERYQMIVYPAGSLGSGGKTYYRTYGMSVRCVAR